MLDKTDGFMPKNCMSGYDFELWVQGILTALKFDAKRSKGNDNGVDIIATLGERGSHLKYYIQCKFLILRILKYDKKIKSILS